MADGCVGERTLQFGGIAHRGLHLGRSIFRFFARKFFVHMNEPWFAVPVCLIRNSRTASELGVLVDTGVSYSMYLESKHPGSVG